MPTNPTANQPVVFGPTKYDLQAALFDKAVSRKVTVNANCPTSAVFEVTVNSVQAEDGSGESWNIEGYAEPWETTRGHAAARAAKDPDNRAFQVRSHRIFMYYRTDTRKGHIRFLD